MSHFEFKSHRKVASPLVFNTGPFVLHLTAGPFTSNFYVACNVQRRTRYIYCLCEILVTCLDVLFEYFVGLLSSFTRRRLSVWSTSTAASLSPAASLSVSKNSLWYCPCFVLHKSTSTDTDFLCVPLLLSSSLPFRFPTCSMS